jgi:hypothetical protein
MTGINGLIVTRNFWEKSNFSNRAQKVQRMTGINGLIVIRNPIFCQNLISQPCPRSTTDDGDKRIDCDKKSDFLPKSDFSNRAEIE